MKDNDGYTAVDLAYINSREISMKFLDPHGTHEVVWERRGERRGREGERRKMERVREGQWRAEMPKSREVKRGRINEVIGGP